MESGDSRLRARRIECGLTQAELARRARVSRQLVAAAEAEQNTPAVDAALRLAHALATTVEQLFGSGTTRVAHAFDGPLREGVPLRVGRVGEQLVVAELPDHGTAAAGWATADGILQAGTLRLFARASPERLVLAGCDPALGIAEAMLGGRGESRLLALSGPTDTALRSLGDRRVHAAAVHGPAGQLPPAPLPILRVHLASWQVGLATAPTLPATTLEDLLARGGAIVQREPAAASQQALRRAAKPLGREIPRGPRARGHIDAARQASILGIAAVTTEPAARAFDLRFLPLERHAVEIWIAEEWADHPGVESLGNLLTSTGFTDRIGAVGGYDLADTGMVIRAQAR